jgi:hypothetical protein
MLFVAVWHEGKVAGGVSPERTAMNYGKIALFHTAVLKSERKPTVGFLVFGEKNETRCIVVDAVYRKHTGQGKRGGEKPVEPFLRRIPAVAAYRDAGSLVHGYETRVFVYNFKKRWLFHGLRL